MGMLTMDDPKLLAKEIALQRRRLLDLLSEGGGKAKSSRKNCDLEETAPEPK
jgi:hypothetical protein